MRFLIAAFCLCLTVSVTASTDHAPPQAPPVQYVYMPPAPPQAPPVVCDCLVSGICICTACECGGAATKVTATATAEPPIFTYESQLARSIKESRKLVVGVGCNAPEGDWLTVRVNAMDGAAAPCLVVSCPNSKTAAGMQWVDTLPANADPRQIAQAFEPKVTMQPMQPQIQFQPIMFGGNYGGSQMMMSGPAFGMARGRLFGGAMFGGGGCAGGSCR